MQQSPLMSEFILHQTLAIYQGLTSRTDHSTPHHTRCLQPELGYSARPSTRKRPHSPSAANVLRTARFLRDINAEVRTDLAHKLDEPEPRRVGMNARKWPTARRDDRGDLASARSRQAQERLLVGEGYSNDNLLFCLPDGRSFHPERFSREFDRKQATYNRLHPLAPLPRLRLHDLRHTWATLAQVS